MIKKFSRVIFILMVVFLCVNYVKADNVDLELISEWKGAELVDIGIYGDYAFCSSTNGLEVYFLGNPAEPVHRVSFSPPLPNGDTGPIYGAFLDISEDGKFLYLACTYGVLFIDISDPLHPDVVGSVEIHGAWDVKVRGDYLFVTDQVYFYIVDITEKTFPAIIYENNFNTDAVYLDYEGDLLAIYGQDGFTLLNIGGDLHNPRIYYSSNPLTYEQNRVSSQGADVKLYRNFLYIISNNFIEVFDVTGPSTPMSVYYVEPEDYAPQSVEFIGDYGYAIEGDFAIVNVHDPANPVDMGWTETEDQPIRLAATGEYAYLTSPDGLTVVDTGNPSNPFVKTVVKLNGSPQNFVADDTYLYIADGQFGLKIMNYTVAGSPSIVSTFQRENQYGDEMGYYEIYKDGNYLYLLASDGSDNGAQGLEVIDVSDVEHPKFVSFFDVYDDTGTLECMYYCNHYAYLGGEYGFAIVDATNVNSLKKANFISLDDVTSITGNGEILAVGLYQKINIYDLSNPASPSLLGHYTVYGVVEDMKFEGDTLYVVDDTELRIFDTSNVKSKADPVSLGYYDFGITHVKALAVNSGYVTVSDEDLNLNFIDCSDPANPQLLSVKELNSVARGLNSFGNYVFAGLNGGSVQIYQISIEENEITAYLPHITWTETWNSYLIADNFSSVASTVTVVIYENGEQVSEKSYTVRAGEQKKIELKGEGCGFVRYDASKVVLKETYKSVQKGIAEFTLNSKAFNTVYLLLPQYYSDRLTWSGFALMNPGNDAASVKVTAYSENGTVLGTGNFVIPAKDKAVGYVSTFIDGVDYRDVARIKVESSQPLTGIVISGYQNERLLFSQAQGEIFRGELPVTHIAAEVDYWDNMLIFDNVGDTDASVTVTFYKGGIVKDEYNYTVEPNSTRTINLSEMYGVSTVPGCGKVVVEEGDVLVRESFIYKSEDGGTAEFVLSDSFSTTAVYNFPQYFSVDLNWVGLSIFNPGDSAATVTARAYSSGIVLAEKTFTILPHTRYVALVENLFADLTYSGVERIVVEGDGAVCGINIAGEGHSRLLFTPSFSPESVSSGSGSGDGEFIDTIHHIYHSGVWIDYNDMTIYIDPVNIENFTPRKADVIFITHPYEDHLDPESIAKIVKRDTVIVSPSAGLDYLSGYDNVMTVTPDNTYTVKGIEFRTIKAYNARFSGGTHYEALGFVGYFIILGENSVYHAGDTDFIDEMRGLQPTVALLPVGGAPEVMTPQDAADAALAIQPQIAVPIHYDLYGSINDAYEFRNLLEGKIDVRILPNEQP